ncbi:zinc alcohol dehydrogenase [Pseudomassariella vexata]|uniref:Zinc alcohol dehydrogenase n=1 Tax=Pseudomassariella vexata TaxID=1141098 RepID=A0A1Y2DT51_9PEZI|nr:zinc alcohol dehydrogenase [Pseudomassariella vexata]ORY62448.1 zinc alcohol dehydrogenase [Pseudomassariella vexata]
MVVQNGEPKDALELKADWPTPALPVMGSNLLVKVSHAGLNPADIHFMAHLPSWLPFRRNAIPGLDFVGEIVQTGPLAPPEMTVGTEVCGSLGVRQVAFGAGSLAEYVLVPSDLVAVKPATLPLAAAVGLGTAGQTAALIMRQAKVQKGARVLINGASGGVGSILIQIAKAKGATVVAICSNASDAHVRRLGADEVIDYKVHQDLYDFIAKTFKESQLDLIIDCMGDDALFTKSPPYLKPDGKFISIVGGRTQGIYPFLKNKFLPVFLGRTPRSYSILGLAPAGTYAREVAQWINDGLVKEVPVDSEFRLEEAVEAYEKQATKRAKGKIVVAIKS